MSRQEAAVAKTALKLSKALAKACDDMNAYTRACRDAGLPFKGADDGHPCQAPAPPCLPPYVRH